MTASLQVVSDRSAMDTDKQKALDAALAQIDRALLILTPVSGLAQAYAR